MSQVVRSVNGRVLVKGDVIETHSGQRWIFLAPDTLREKVLIARPEKRGDARPRRMRSFKGLRWVP